MKTNTVDWIKQITRAILEKTKEAWPFAEVLSINVQTLENEKIVFLYDVAPTPDADNAVSFSDIINLCPLDIEIRLLAHEDQLDCMEVWNEESKDKVITDLEISLLSILETNFCKQYVKKIEFGIRGHHPYAIYLCFHAETPSTFDKKEELSFYSKINEYIGHSKTDEDFTECYATNNYAGEYEDGKGLLTLWEK